MGVKDLWNILSPLGERKPLYELEGKTVAIDLSCWVIDSQSVTDNIAHPNMYLRNLYFRTSNFLLHNTFPVFVLEGDAPSLKHKTIAKRNEVRHGGAKKESKRRGRSHFNYVLRECQKLLSYLGLVCIKSHGEAESMCAYLNADGLVDGCISQDSDCFLYGAKTVYRNFCTTAMGQRTGSVDEYTIEKIQQVLKLGRNKMIALALLCGCDYDDGVNGVGKEAALKLFKVVNENEIIERLKMWRTDFKFNVLEAETNDPNICTNCGHLGKIKIHKKVGCNDCGTNINCQSTYKEKRLLITNELSIRKKALLTANFPNQEIIDEFLVRKGAVPSKLDLKWRKPQLMEFIMFVEKKLQWEPSYAFSKIFPLATRWQLLNVIEYPIEQRTKLSDVFFPKEIRKIRKIRSIESYEILWIDKNNLVHEKLFEDAIDKENNDESIHERELITVEPKDIVEKCYPSIVDEFINLQQLKKKRKNKTTKVKENNIICENKDSKTRKRSKNPNRKPRSNLKDNGSDGNILEYFKPKLCNLEDSFRKMNISSIESPERKSLRLSKRLDTEIEQVLENSLDKNEIIEQLALKNEVVECISLVDESVEVKLNDSTSEGFASGADDSFDMSKIIYSICKKTRTSNVVELGKDKIDIFEQTDAKTQSRLLSLNVSQNEPTDEFDNFDETYIPLHKRLNVDSSVKAKSIFNFSLEKVKKFSLGIDDLLNKSDTSLELSQ